MGEGYYADRTSKQTVEILQRRGKSLDSQVDSLQLMINNLNSFIKVADSEVEVCFTISLIILRIFYFYLHCGNFDFTHAFCCSNGLNMCMCVCVCVCIMV